MATYIFHVLEYRGETGKPVGYLKAVPFTRPGHAAVHAAAFRRIGKRFQDQHPDLTIKAVYTLEEGLVSGNEDVRRAAQDVIARREAEANAPSGPRGWAALKLRDPERFFELTSKGGRNCGPEKRYFRDLAAAREAGRVGGAVTAERNQKSARRRRRKKG